MSNSSLNTLLKYIGKFSQQIRQKLTEYGFSTMETNNYLAQLITQDEEIKALRQQQDPMLKKDLTLKNDNKPISFEDVVMKEMKKCNQSVERYLTSIVGKLEIQLAQLEEYQKISDNLQVQKMPELSITSIEENTIKPSSTYLQNSYNQASSASEIQKVSNQSSTQIQSLQQQQARLESTLRSMVQKTKILRVMLEKQLLMSSMKRMEDIMENRDHHYMPISGSFMA